MTATDNTEPAVIKPAPAREDAFDRVDRVALLVAKIEPTKTDDTTVAQMPAFASIYGSVFDASPSSPINPVSDVNRLLLGTSRNPELLRQFAMVTGAKLESDKPSPTKDWPLGNDNAALLKSRKEVMELAQSRGLDMTAFAESMRKLEERAQKKETNLAEVQSTYDNVSRLLRNNGNNQLEKKDMNRLASQIMNQAGNPSLIFQGDYNTCSVAATEVRTYARTPGAAAKLVADVAEKGFFRSALDGTRVDIDRKPHGESRQESGDRIRTHASEIFQVTAANLYWADLGKQYSQIDPGRNGGYLPGGKKKTDNGERLVDKKTGRPVDGGEEHDPGIPDNGYAKIVSRITGKPETNVVIMRTEALDAPSPTVLQPKTPEQFEAMLAQLKKQGKLPIMAGVESNYEPFRSDHVLHSGKKEGGTADDDESGPHQVTIRDYIPAAPGQPGRILIDNTWRQAVDRLNPNIEPARDAQGRIPAGAALTVRQMWDAMGEWKKPRK